ncbi:Hypothetical predicted protein [Podarcis lilfordi]|nr:Hypothetical predicted protein [Podarcis lilfordi]
MKAWASAAERTNNMESAPVCTGCATRQASNTSRGKDVPLF